MPQLELIDVCASYGGLNVLKNISLSAERGEILGLIGPSGSGKSTLLRVLVGLLPPDSGSIQLDGRRIDYTQAREIKALRDRLSIVFQQFNLFQNMTVLKNVTIAPVKIKGRDRRQVDTEARELLAKVGLADKVDAFPDQLSGGQQQRVAIARALALKPEILLLDEVTASLDPELVSEVLDTIRLLASEGMTMLIVSHEMGFIRELCSRVVFMADGRVVEVDHPQVIFDSPSHERTRGFVSKILRH